MLVESIRAATHEPVIRFKTDVTEARKNAVDLAIAEAKRKAEQGETSVELTLDHISNARYQLVDWLRSYFEKEGFHFESNSTPERLTVIIKW
ncbi:hypothetical protein ACIJC2_003385 [Vibrio parahaemolyticus]